MAGLVQTVLTMTVTATPGVTLPVSGQLRMNVIPVLNMQSETMMQMRKNTGSASASNGGPAMTVASTEDHVHQHATAVQAPTLTNARTVLPTPTTTLMEVASVVMSGWEPIALINVQTAMRHVKSV